MSIDGSMNSATPTDGGNNRPGARRPGRRHPPRRAHDLELHRHRLGLLVLDVEGESVAAGSNGQRQHGDALPAQRQAGPLRVGIMLPRRITARGDGTVSRRCIHTTRPLRNRLARVTGYSGQGD
jgi:hypothetical protein